MADWKPLAQVPEFMAQVFQSVPDISTPVLSDSSLPAGQAGGSIPLPQPPAFHGTYLAPNIPTYIWQSVLALVISAGMMMVICAPIGMPFAIVALVYASKVEGLRLHGRLVEAASASRSAKLWMIISYVLSGLVFLGLIVVLVFVVFAAASGSTSP